MGETLIEQGIRNEMKVYWKGKEKKKRILDMFRVINNGSGGSDTNRNRKVRRSDKEEAD